MSALTSGMRIGGYQIVAKLGEGGMGEVYRATDSNLKRSVAIKVLPSSVAGDTDRLARFQREAEVLAALNHPNIASVYGLEKTSEVTALVMELVDGEDLSQRIARGPIPFDEALPIAKQIAEALEAAHEAGIVHRDLKPANIKVRPDGTVKVLDFGLAKAMDQGSGIRDQGLGGVANSPTITSPAMTQAGVILGTAAYMSPEQAKGKVVDRRTDIWAFGCVLYEMLTGTRAFPGEDVSDMMVAVLSKEPDWARLPSGDPATTFLVRRCLEKDPRKRLRDIGEARLAFDGVFTAVTAAAPAATNARSAMLVGSLAAALVVIAMLAVPAMRGLSDTPPAAVPEIRLDIVTPQTEDPDSFALSPDGAHIVYVASGDGGSRLWLRPLSATTAQPLGGTEGARSPFWSPDGQSIGFFASGALKRIDIASSAVRVLARILTSGGGTWSRDGVIVFAPALGSPLMRVSAAGGEATPATALAPKQTGHVAPWFLPDGLHFLYRAIGTPDVSGIFLAEMNGGRTPTRLTESSGNSRLSGAVFVPLASSSTQGWLLWMPAGTLQARRLDVDQAILSGEPMTLGDRVDAVSVTTTGVVAYRAQTQRRRQLTWLSRSGAALGTVGDAEFGVGAPRISPDGRRIAVSRTVQGNTDVWILDGARSTRLTFDPALDSLPIWSPDGIRIAFSSTRTGSWTAFQKLTSGAGPEDRLIPNDILGLATSWSPDGRFILCFQADQPGLDAASTDLFLIPMASGRAGSPVRSLSTPINEVFAAFSPDGRWVAFQVDQFSQEGRSEIFVRPFVSPAAGAPAVTADGQWQVSTGGGIRPIWSRDGKELYFLDPAGRMMAAPIAVKGSVLEPGAPMALFATRIADGGEERQQATQYDVAPDGRFLVNRELGETAPPITLLVNWRPPQ